MVDKFVDGKTCRQKELRPYAGGRYARGLCGKPERRAKKKRRERRQRRKKRASKDGGEKE